MGIRDFFKRRRERESALPPGQLDELGGAIEGPPSERSTGGDSAEAEQAREIELPGADAAALGEIIRRAATSGEPQVSFESHTVPLDGPQGARIASEILEALSGQGIAGANGYSEIDPDEARELRDRVRDALRRAGIDPDSGEPL